MLMPMLDLGDLTADQAALSILQAFGAPAWDMAVKQIEQHAAEPDVAARWKAIATAITAFSQANLHMEIALEMLDSTGNQSAGPHLDAAITALGVRQPSTERVLTGIASPEQSEQYYAARFQQHLDIASAAEDQAIKGLHLNIASRYATLRELAAREIANNPVRG